MKKAEQRKYRLQVSALLALLVLGTVVIMFTISQNTRQTLRGNAAISNKDLPQLVTSEQSTAEDLASASATPVVITIPDNQNPVASIDTPTEDAHYKAGETITFSGQATDSEDGTLAASAFMWKVEKIVNVQVTSVVQDWKTGVTSGSFATADTGDPNPETSYRITLVVTDSSGATSQVSRDVLPTWVRMNFYTEPEELNLVVDEQTHPAGFYVINVVGFKRDFAAPASQVASSSGKTYNFVSWSDGGTAAHTITAPETETTYIATYADASGTPNPTQVVTTTTPSPSVMLSPTSSATSFPTPTGTESATTRVSLNIALDGIGTTGDSLKPTGSGNATPKHTQRTVNVSVYGSDNVALIKNDGTLVYDSATGKFTGVVDLGSSLSDGTYTVKVKPVQFLQEQAPGNYVLTKGVTTTVPEMRFINGDIVGDNVLNILDYNALIGCYTDILPAPACIGEEAAIYPDLTDDGFVNQFDYNLFLRELKAIS